MKIEFQTEKYDDSNHCKEEQPKSKQVSILKFVLIALFVVNLLFAVINVIFKFHEYYIAIGALETVVSVISLFMFFYYRKTKNVKIAIHSAILIMTVMLVIFFALAGSGMYAFYWMSVYPPVVYFLLGSKKADIIVGLFFTYIFLFMISPFVGWNSTKEMVDSVINMAIATAGVIFFIRHFDISRSESAYAIEEKNRELEELVKIDYLTGIYNRIKLDGILGSELKSASNGASTFSIILVDLDNFKRINDTFGHLIGDSVLIDTAQVLKKSCPETNTIGRWGWRGIFDNLPSNK